MVPCYETAVPAATPLELCFIEPVQVVCKPMQPVYETAAQASTPLELCILEPKIEVITPSRPSYETAAPASMPLELCTIELKQEVFAPSTPSYETAEPALFPVELKSIEDKSDEPAAAVQEEPESEYDWQDAVSMYEEESIEPYITEIEGVEFVRVETFVTQDKIAYKQLEARVAPTKVSSKADGGDKTEPDKADAKQIRTWDPGGASLLGTRVHSSPDTSACL